MESQITIRRAMPEDAGEIGALLFRAFGGIARKHSFPLDFPVPEMTAGFAAMMTSHPACYGVVAEQEGKVVGCNFLDERDTVRAVGPIAVDPDLQSQGAGRKLMQAVLDRARGAAAVRLVQDAFNTVSMSLYASLGFEVKEPLVMMRGKVRSQASPQSTIRPLTEADVPACAELCRRVHGIDRANDVRGAIQHFKPLVLERDGRVLAYATTPTFWIQNHGMAENEADLRELLRGASAMNKDPIEFLLPTRQASLFRWCLEEGLRVVKPMTLMTIGEYHEPRGAYYVSVLY